MPDLGRARPGARSPSGPGRAGQSGRRAGLRQRGGDDDTVERGRPWSADLTAALR